MGKFLSNLIGIIGALWLGIAGGYATYWWDRRPHGYPAVETHVLFWPVKLVAPDSLTAQLVAARAAEAKEAQLVEQAGARLAQCQVGERAALHAVAEQDEAVEAAKAAGDARVALAERAAAQAVQGRKRAFGLVDRINATPANGNACHAAEGLIRRTIR